MVTNYYNASNNFSAPIRREPKPFRPVPPKEHQPAVPAPANNVKLDQDSLLLLGLLLFLLLSGCSDTALLLVLGYLLLF